MNKIIEVAENKDKILAFGNKVYCSECGELQYSLFGKLFTSSYGVCEDCTSEDQLLKKSENIFKIL